MPTVSVIIPTYNRADYVLETLASVFAQTYPDYEIIVVDDGSTDDTRAVLAPLAQSGTIRYVFQENQGESAARNHAIHLAEGEFLAFLDSDDLMLPAKLQKQASFLAAHPEMGLVHSCFNRFNNRGEDLGYRDTSHLTGWVYPEILLDWSVLIPPSTVMVRKEVLEDVGGFLAGMRWGPDLDLWRRVTRKYPIGMIPESLTKMRFHAGSISSDKVAAVASFERYLQRAFADDASLGARFQRRAYAKMYSNAGHNILASGVPEQMFAVRHFSLKAIRQWPFQWSAYLGWLGSWAGAGVRDTLLRLWRKMKYA